MMHDIRMTNPLISIPRQDEDLDQLVREVMESDLALRAIIGEAEMLIFPSILLPKQHQSTCCSRFPLLITLLSIGVKAHSHKTPMVGGVEKHDMLLAICYYKAE